MCVPGHRCMKGIEEGKLIILQSSEEELQPFCDNVVKAVEDVLC